eukprot:m.145174 g.145174  ORF g.145174 m.145174 type:complete len:149 (+) comp17215_c1_seq1:96-542(+)
MHASKQHQRFNFPPPCPLQITHVLNVADDVPNFHEGDADELTYLRLEVQDEGKDAGISRVFGASTTFVREALAHGGVVLVHCANGTNRSATVTIALVMQLQSLSLHAAVNLVRSKRRVYPIRDNQRELLCFERELNGTTANTMTEGDF